MKNCCQVTNPLRRDGTSQPERFPAPLADDYVRIDERSPRDLLNFTRQIATQFNYYNGNHDIDGDWGAFFEEDLSFLLARIAQLDLDLYRGFFETHKGNMVDYFEATGIDATFEELVEEVFGQFLGTVGTHTGETLLAFPNLIDKWYELLPPTELFGDGQELYSYRDEVDEARGKMASFMQNLHIAYYEAAAAPDLNLTNLQAQFDGLGEAWGVDTAPDISTRKYFLSATTEDHIPKLIDLFQACFDTFLGIVRSLQARIPNFLDQSFAEYPYHEPQNGLFLAFIQLFQHAQDHINTLGPKHLLYHYRDVLRFAEQAAVPDQAVLIFQLRKGVAQYKIDAGTQLKAGKDASGNPLYYAVDREVVVNQATLAAIQTVYVERPEGQNSAPVKGIFAAPVANSADGQGADLDAEEPKWNVFGERQGSLAEAQRTMLDAEVGFAIASPVLVLREGQRKIFLTLNIDSGNNKYRPGFYLANSQRRYEAEADVRHGLEVHYSSEEGMAPAAIERVFVAHRTEFLQGHDDLGDWSLPRNVWSGSTYLCLEIALEETDPAFIPYDAELHGGDYASYWPLLKLVFRGQSDRVQDLGLEPAIFTAKKKPSGSFALAPTVFQKNKIYLYEGRAYRAEQSGKLSNIRNNFTPLDDFQAILAAQYSAYNAGSTYFQANEVLFEEQVYRSNQSVQVNESPSTHPEKWDALDFAGSLYPYFDKSTLKTIDIKVAASGIENIYLENDTGRLKPGKPFRPLGSIPTIGSRFWIGSMEIFGKKLTSLELSLLWKDPPGSLATHYNGYLSGTKSKKGGAKDFLYGGSKKSKQKKVADEKTSGKDAVSGGKKAPPKGAGQQSEQPSKGDSEPFSPKPATISNTSFKVDVDRLAGGNWQALGGRQNLFHSSNATNLHTIAFTEGQLAAFDRALNLTEPTVYSPDDPVGFLRLELSAPSMAFGHKLYPKILLDEAMKAGDNDANTTPNYPNEPYSPILQEFKLAYSSAVTLDLTQPSRSHFDGRIEQFFHVHPFGHVEQHPYENESETVTLVEPYGLNEAYLYLGFASLVPPTSLSVLFQLAEGSGDPTLDRNDPVWSYLRDNRWTDLDAVNIVSDSTRGLLASGVIQFTLPKSMNAGNTVLDGGLHWLRARVGRNSAAIDKALAIIPQAVVASFIDQNNNPEHLRTSLPSGTIAGLRVNDAAVKKVQQPYASDGGKLPEQDTEFLTRVSERLRHKYRSINIWDYERMVLEEFPGIYKVKCLNHTQVTNDSEPDREIAPGHVTVVCIPDLRNKNAVNPFEPRTPVHVLDEIELFLDQYVSPWVELKVKNPRYETVTIACTVGFYAGRDPGFYLAQLDADLKEFLSPWAFDSEEDIVFGGGIHRSQIIHFIEQRDYIDFVVDLKLFHDVGDGSLALPVKEAVASTARSILVSALSHDITAQEGPVICLPSTGEVLEKKKNDCCTQTADLKGC